MNGDKNMSPLFLFFSFVRSSNVECQWLLVWNVKKAHCVFFIEFYRDEVKWKYLPLFLIIYVKNTLQKKEWWRQIKTFLKRQYPSLDHSVILGYFENYSVVDFFHLFQTCFIPVWSYRLFYCIRSLSMFVKTFLEINFFSFFHLEIELNFFLLLLLHLAIQLLSWTLCVCVCDNGRTHGSEMCHFFKKSFVPFWILSHCCSCVCTHKHTHNSPLYNNHNLNIYQVCVWGVSRKWKVLNDQCRYIFSIIEL